MSVIQNYNIKLVKFIPRKHLTKFNVIVLNNSHVLIVETIKFGETVCANCLDKLKCEQGIKVVSF